MRGEAIIGTFFHDAGAYVQCVKCRRYYDNPRALHGEHSCVCGASFHHLTGSFKKPTEDSLWGDLQPATGAAQNAA